MESDGDQVRRTLHDRFQSLQAALDIPLGTRTAWADALVAAYSEPQRHYHTTSHIHAMLQLLGRYKAKAPDAVELAIYFHDWVYDPRAKDNELQSVAVFERFAAETNVGNNVKLCDRVRRYITATIKHSLATTEDQEDSDLKLFLDLDLEVLSREESAYQQYAREIRQEYSHIELQDYRKGRAAVLGHFLERERLYFSEAFEGREAQARHNLRAEIDTLQHVSVEPFQQ